MGQWIPIAVITLLVLALVVALARRADQPSSTAPSSIFAGPVTFTAPRATTPAPNVHVAVDLEAVGLGERHAGRRGSARRSRA